MHNNLHKILFANDLRELTYIINEFIEIAKLLEDNRELLELMTALDRFYYAYEPYNGSVRIIGEDSGSKTEAPKSIGRKE